MSRIKRKQTIYCKSETHTTKSASNSSFTSCFKRGFSTGMELGGKALLSKGEAQGLTPSTTKKKEKVL
jgi:hypothetical protein